MSSLPPQPARNMGATRTTASAAPRAPDPDRSPDIVLLDSAQRRTQTRIVGRRPLLAGLAAVLVVGAHVSPLSHWADTRSFAAHMAQHLLLGDLAPLALVLGLRCLYLCRALSPKVTFPAWLANLYVWHVPVVYEAALHHVGVHALQHVALFAGGLLLWAPVFEL